MQYGRITTTKKDGYEKARAEVVNPNLSRLRGTYEIAAVSSSTAGEPGDNRVVTISLFKYNTPPSRTNPDQNNILIERITVEAPSVRDAVAEGARELAGRPRVRRLLT